MKGSDRIARLEALSRLKRDGTLTEAEFETEKHRVLDAVSDGDDGKVAKSIGWRLPATAAAVVAMLAAAGWFGIRMEERPQIVSSSTPVAPSHAAAPSVRPSPSTTPAFAPPAEPVLDDVLVFSNPRSCVSGEVLGRIYAKFDRAMNDGSRQSVKLDAFTAPAVVKATSRKDADGVWNGSAELRLPTGSRWHGLRITRVTSSWLRPPETDSVHERTVNFLDQPDQVLRTLNRLGFRVKRDPAYSELPDTYNSCGGAMSVEARNGGSALVCGWGC